MAKYEYIFVRLTYGFKTPDYQKIIHEYADKGWRLTQIFTYTAWLLNRSPYFELIFEREIEK